MGILIMVLAVVGIYVGIFGFDRGVKLFRVWAVEFTTKDRKKFDSYFYPITGKAIIDKVEKKTFSVVGVVIKIDLKEKKVGLLEADGYKEYGLNSRSILRYKDNCGQKNVIAIMQTDTSFDEWAKRVKRGDFVDVIYLSENKKLNPIPSLVIGFYRTIPYGTRTSQWCLTN